MICSILTLNSISCLVFSSLSALLSRQELAHQHHKPRLVLRTPTFPPRQLFLLCTNHSCALQYHSKFLATDSTSIEVNGNTKLKSMNFTFSLEWQNYLTVYLHVICQL